MVYKVDENPQLDSRGWRILKKDEGFDHSTLK